MTSKKIIFLGLFILTIYSSLQACGPSFFTPDFTRQPSPDNNRIPSPTPHNPFDPKHCVALVTIAAKSVPTNSPACKPSISTTHVPAITPNTSNDPS